ncbi:heme utilization cystosolic carrier protein HutX [Salinivibrio sharmensis]|uniref:HuvX protein n=1 Tax=Salinivibrio sharmensis TaxID=390883 RepID=A0ABX3KFM6_9GAMM|nr:heme utilization cystosolic carrier protein HutX [Salinivibrio sharmensis]OOE87571.1 HuvX protein [Salinivibrio sharmensis]
MTTTTLNEQVDAILADNASILPADIAKTLGVSEGEAVRAMPAEYQTWVDGQHAETVFTQVAEWGGPVTAIVHSGGSIFEVKAPFPKGKIAYGYYNLMGKPGEMHGHLKLERMAGIAFVSKPFRGKTTHYIGFFTEQGESIFKIYLGRDEKRQLLDHQVEAFHQLKTQLATSTATDREQ